WGRGNQFAFVADDGEWNSKPPLMTINPLTRAEAVIVDSSASSPEWSPDGTQLAFVRDGDIWLAATDGSDPHKLTDRGDIYSGPSWQAVHSSSYAVRKVRYDGLSHKQRRKVAITLSGSGIHLTGAAVASRMTCVRRGHRRSTISLTARGLSVSRPVLINPYGDFKAVIKFRAGPLKSGVLTLVGKVGNSSAAGTVVLTGASSRLGRCASPKESWTALGK
ncbi:MAG: DPP IV N-terminal domain-containing protein, partial [Solirubrobacterales bacterium]|nr:DPP IV N-terminal domain-containing protein [Solirubrobacterales bacterium]